MTPELMIYNGSEGYHWKFYILGNEIKVQGNSKPFKITPDIV
jgi:hypothetical protein